VARIKLDLDRRVGRLDRRVFGGFIEHLGRCIYGGIFDENSPLSDERGYRSDVLEAAKNLRIQILRWPGENRRTRYPWDGSVEINVEAEGECALMLRIAAWCEEDAAVEVNTEPVDAELSPGSYAKILRAWRLRDTINMGTSPWGGPACRVPSSCCGERGTRRAYEGSLALLCRTVRQPRRGPAGSDPGRFRTHCPL